MSVGKRMQRYLVACLSVIITAALALVPFANTAFAVDDSVPINEQTFPNLVLRKAVSYFDDDKDGALSASELNKLYSLDVVCRDDKPASMKGLELLPNLHSLSIEKCKVTDFTLARIPEVSNLTLSDNGLTEINLSGRAMSSFASMGNSIRSIDLSSSKELSSLTITGSLISSLDLSNKIELRELTVSGNKRLTDIKLPKYGHLVRVDLSSNSLSSIDVRGLEGLWNLDVSNNHLSEIDVTTISSLYSLDISNNQISDIDLSQNRSVVSLSLNNNRLTELDLYNNHEIGILNYSNNQFLAILPPASGIPAFAYPGDQSYEDVYVGSSFDVSTVAPLFDSARVSNLKGAELRGTSLILSTNTTEHKVSYDYRINDNTSSWQDPDLVLHANLILRKATMLTVNFDSNGGTPVESVEAIKGKAIEAPTPPSRTGYSFDGWFTAKSDGSEFDFSKPIIADVTLYAQWTANKYSVTFDSNGGSAVSAASVEYEKTVAQPASPSRAGYAFAGWFTARTGGAKYDFNRPVTSDMTLYAQWIANKQTVTFDANGGSAVAAATVEYGQKAVEPAVPSRTGYTFNGWYTAKSGGEKFDFTKPVTADMTLYAQWIADKQTVKFDSNGGSTVASATVEYGQKVAQPAAPSRTGYTFAGWYTAKDGGSKYDFTKPVTADMTLYARWTINKYEVKFDTDGGSAVKSATVEHGKTVVKPEDPTRTNYTFTGWYTAKTGGEKFDFAKPITSNVTVFAQWQPRIVFSDVTDKTPHFEDIIWLADNGVSTGWLMADGRYEFRGMDTVKRQDMAAFLRRLAAKYGIAGAKDFKPVAADWKRFKDVNSKTPHAEDILWLAKSGISTGWQETDGSWTFRGMDTVKRQDMAAFLYRLADKAGKAGGVRPKTDFTDVTAKTPHYKDVEWLGGSGISQGYRNANGTWRFEGMTSVYRQDMAAFLHRLNERLTK